MWVYIRRFRCIEVNNLVSIRHNVTRYLIHYSHEYCLQCFYSNAVKSNVEKNCQSVEFGILKKCVFIINFISLSAVDDLIANRSEKKLARRHSITVCESPGKVPANGGFNWPWSRFRRSPQDSIPEHEDAADTGSESRTPVNEACSVVPGCGPDKTPTNNLSHSRLSCCSDHKHDKMASSLSQLNASELMHVSWKTECPRKSHSQSTAPCEDCRPVPVSTSCIPYWVCKLTVCCRNSVPFTFHLFWFSYSEVL